ncbi:MAG: aspartate-semialdehyde dehydrogenase [Fibrobacter sp.]|nr:aspartate-semialdehyde dehydrogenase [Fibrobacter sp.]
MSKNVAVIGASGAVGQEILGLLAERNFPINELKLLASKRSAGKTVSFGGKDIVIEELTHDSFTGIDIVFSSAGGSISKEFVPSAVKAGAVVVDNTSHYRMDPNVPLIIPEINGDEAKKHQGIIANPNCSTIIMAVPLYPLHKAFGVTRVHSCTYQAASGAGVQAMEELREESLALAQGQSYERTVIPHQYAFNLFPHNAPFNDGSPANADVSAEVGYCEEEWKMVAETAKIFGEDAPQINAMCVRVPILRAHSEALNITFDKDVSVEEIYEVLGNAPGVKVQEDPANNRWPMPIDASGIDPILVGRIRKDVSLANTYDLWVVGDQIRKGAALNTVQIAELLL